MLPSHPFQSVSNKQMIKYQFKCRFAEWTFCWRQTREICTTSRIKFFIPCRIRTCTRVQLFLAHGGWSWATRSKNKLYSSSIKSWGSLKNVWRTTWRRIFMGKWSLNLSRINQRKKHEPTNLEFPRWRVSSGSKTLWTNFIRKVAPTKSEIFRYGRILLKIE